MAEMTKKFRDMGSQVYVDAAKVKKSNEALPSCTMVVRIVPSAWRRWWMHGRAVGVDDQVVLHAGLG